MAGFPAIDSSEPSFRFPLRFPDDLHPGEACRDQEGILWYCQTDGYLVNLLDRGTTSLSGILTTPPAPAVVAGPVAVSYDVLPSLTGFWFGPFTVGSLVGLRVPRSGRLMSVELSALYSPSATMAIELTLPFRSVSANFIGGEARLVIPINELLAEGAFLSLASVSVPAAQSPPASMTITWFFEWA